MSAPHNPVDAARLSLLLNELRLPAIKGVGGGLLANIQKGTTFHFDQAPVAEGLWLPTGGEATVQARILLLKNMRQHFTEKVYNYQRFKVETDQAKDAKIKKD